MGTARNQLKAVMRKLGIGSQSELVSLYAGFANSYALNRVTDAEGHDSAFGKAVTLADGSEVRLERYGKAGGKPVVLLHGAIEGPFFTPRMQHAAHQAELEILVPWMPFYAAPGRVKDPRRQVEAFADRIPQLLDALQIDRCVLLGVSLSCAYALAAATRAPDRFRAVLLCAVPLPLDEAEGGEGMHPLWRAPLVLGRKAPSFVEMLVRTLVRLSMRGEAYLYFERLLKDSPLDLETLHRPDVASVVRKAFANRPDKAGRALAHALLLQTLDWDDWLEPAGVPVSVVIGAQDVVHAPDLQVAFCARRGFEAVGPTKGMGGFSLFQQPGIVFSVVRGFFDN